MFSFAGGYESRQLFSLEIVREQDAPCLTYSRTTLLVYVIISLLERDIVSDAMQLMICTTLEIWLIIYKNLESCTLKGYLLAQVSIMSKY